MVVLRYCRPDVDPGRDAEKRRLLREIGERHGVEVEEVDAVRSGYGAGSVLIVVDDSVRWKSTYDPSLEFLREASERGLPFVEEVLESGEPAGFHA